MLCAERRRVCDSVADGVSDRDAVDGDDLRAKRDPCRLSRAALADEVDDHRAFVSLTNGNAESAGNSRLKVLGE